MTFDLAEKSRRRRRIWLWLVVLFLILPTVLLFLGAFILFGAFETTSGSLHGYFALGLLAASVWLLTDKLWGLRVFFGATAVVAGAMGFYHLGASLYKDRFTPVVANEIKTYAYDPASERNQLARLDQPAALSLNALEAPRLDGATALYPLYASFAMHTYPKGLFKRDEKAPRQHVHVGKTSGAYQALNEGLTDLIFVAGPSKAQREQAAAAGVDLHMTPIGREAFVFYVAADNPVGGLTQDQIRAIYSGQTTNWSSLGGKRRAIRAFQRPEGSGSQTMLKHIMGGVPLMPELRENRVGEMFGVVNQTADYRSYPGAIGYSFRVYVANILGGGDVRLLAIDGVDPKPETILDGSYPFTTEFYAVTDGPPDPAEKRLIDWILSSQGRRLIEMTGYVPLPAP